MHTGPMSESQGEFGAETKTDRTCPKCCKKNEVTYRAWESSCGGYVDEKFTCHSCGHTWWVEGTDA